MALPENEKVLALKSSLHDDIKHELQLIPDISSLMAVIKKMQWEIDSLKRKLSGKYFDNSKTKAFQSRSSQLTGQIFCATIVTKMGMWQNFAEIVLFVQSVI